MPTIAIRGAVLAALLAVASPTSAREPVAKAVQASSLSPSARSAASVVDAFHAALRRGDTRSAAAMLAADALIFEGGGIERSRAEYASHHLAADAAYSQAVPAVVTRRSGDSAGSVAWIASEGRTTGTFRGQAVARVTAETMILRRIGGSWKIVHIHWSSAAKP